VTGYITPEYAAQHPIFSTKGKKHPTVFKSHYFSPLPKKRLIAMGKLAPGTKRDHKHKDKDAKKSKELPLKVIQTPLGHMIRDKGFVIPEYQEKLDKWRPVKSKRTLVPAPVVFTELHFQLAAESDPAASSSSSDSTSTSGGKPEEKPRLPTTKLTFKPTIVKKGRMAFYGKHHKLPVFTNTKTEDRAMQIKERHKYQYATIHPPSFFKPQPHHHKRGSNDRHHRKRSSDDRHHRFAEADVVEEDGEEEDVAADAPELSAVPTMDSLPALNLESTDVAAQLSSQESTMMNEIESETMAPAQKDRAKESLATFFTEVKALLANNH